MKVKEASMYRIEQPNRGKQIIWMAAVATFMLLGQAGIARAQWATNVNNINNTNTGNVGVGTPTPNFPLEVNIGSAQYSVPAINILTSSHAMSERATIGFGLNTAVTQGWVLGQDFSANGTRDFYLYDVTNSRSIMYWGATGNVGIGRTDPEAKLNVVGDFMLGGLTDTTVSNYNFSVRGSGFSINGGNGRGLTIKAGDSDNSAGKVGGDLTLNPGTPVSPATTYGNVLMATTGGKVGIGTTTPTSTAKLDVNGNVNITGNLTATGNIAAKYQDVAEWVEAAHALAAGTVVILNPLKSNQVIVSSQPYDTRVAGVVSAQPGIALGEGGEGKVLVATTGRVKVKVDATNAPIHVGDLLVTSDKEGVAMKSEPLKIGGVQLHRPGTLLGKALEPMESGVGEILVLLSLQ